jgi:hypothetical protein
MPVLLPRERHGQEVSNEGSHCACEWCEANLDHLTDPDTGAVITLADHFDALADEEDWP